MGRRLALLVVAVVTATVSLFGTSLARAQTEPPVTAVGWWTDRALAQEKGDKGFEVARALDGTSVAAVTITSGGTVTSATLTLTEVEGGTLRPEDATVAACATDPFEAVQAGELADAPTTECTGGVTLARAGDGTWTGDITVLLTGPASSVAIVPGPVAADASPLDPGFVLEFKAPAVTLTTATDAEAPAPTTDTVSPPTPDSSSPGPGPSPSSGFSPAPVPSFDSPPVESAPVTTVAAPVDASTSESTEIAGPTINSGPISGGSGDAKPWIRLLVLVPMSALAGGVAVFGRRAVGPGTA